MFDKEELLKDWEMKLVCDAAFKDGFIQGKAEIEKKVAKKMLALNFAIDMISRVTGLTECEIENLTDEDFKE